MSHTIMSYVMTGWCWRRGVNAWVVFLLGVGVLVLVIGIFSDLYSPGIGVIGLVAAWVLALSLGAYCARPREPDIW